VASVANATSTATASANNVERANGSKLAALVADRIVGDITAAGWPEGEIVGSEPDLLERYGVSRAVFREAVRLLEHLHVARMRRGPGGGLVVMSPTVDAVTDAVSVYLYYVGAEIDEVFDARLALEELSAELATQRVNKRGRAQLEEAVERDAEGGGDHREIHKVISSLAANPALAFFVDLLNRMTLLYLPKGTTLARSTFSASHVAHEKIAAAIVEGDAAVASRRMRKHLAAEAEFLRRRRPSRRRLAELPHIAGRSDKRAEQTARQVFQDIARSGWNVGELLGSEAELMERYDVSRAVWREAVRVLEHHQIARMRRGPGGGFFVAEPGAEAVTEAIALQVDRLGIEPKHLFEVRTAIELIVLDRVLEHIDGHGEEMLNNALEAERNATRTDFMLIGHDLHFVLAKISGNRVLELLTAVLLRLTRFHAAPPPGTTGPVPTQPTMHVHSLIVEAIAAGNLGLARGRMKKHLDALTRWSR
jgi:DNA-binding FadR family transcriptional regulator